MIRSYLSYVLSGIQSRWMEIGRDADLPIKITEDRDFLPLFNCLRHRIQEVDAQDPDRGKQGDFLSRDDETKIRAHLDLERPDHRLWATLFAVGTRACLRGGELARMKTTDVKRGSDDAGKFFRIGVFEAKEIKPSMNPQTSRPRLVQIYCLHEDDRFDAYALLDKYLSLRASIPEMRLWLTPKRTTKPGTPPFKATPYGKHALRELVATVVRACGVDKHITPHSFRATGATRMIKAGIPEQQARQRTGHSSTNGFNTYIRQSSSRSREMDESIAFKHPAIERAGIDGRAIQEPSSCRPIIIIEGGTQVINL